MEGRENGNGSGSRSVERALRLLLAVASTEGITLSAAARETELATSTAARLLNSLEAIGFASRDTAGRYHAGPRLLQVGAVAVGNVAVYNIADPYLRDLSELTGETAYLAIPDGPSSAVYLRQVESNRAIRHASWVGRAIRTEGTALGAALAGQTEGNGFALSRATKVEPEAAAAAAPVFDSSGSIAAAISIIGPSYRISESDLERFGEAVRDNAERISVELGHIRRRESATSEPPHGSATAYT
jgi:DNA-binding IclR family transcriptional regulator